jgi:hypothetical protein
MGMPRPTRPGDAGDVYDLMGAYPAGGRAPGCTFADADDGRCLSLDGTTGSVDCGARPDLDFTTGPFAVMFRARADSATVGYVAVGRGVFELDGWYVFFNNDGSVSLQMHAPGVLYAIGTDAGAYSAGGAMHHYAFVRTSTTAGAIYVDGVSQALDPSYEGSGVLGDAASDPARHLFLGQYDSGANYFGGLLDDVRVFPFATTAPEVARVAFDPWRGVRPRRRLARLAAAVAGTSSAPVPPPWPLLFPSLAGS